MKHASNSATHLRVREEEVSLDRLEQRLEDGYRMIETHKRAGADVADLEAFWIDLLHQYEDLCNTLPMAA